MPTAVIKDTIDIIAAKLSIGFSNGEPGFPLTSDLATDRDRLSPGLWYYQISWAYTGKDRSVDANIAYHGYELTIWIRYRIVPQWVNGEANWTRGFTCEELVRRLGDPAFYAEGITPPDSTNPDFYSFQSGSDSLTLSEMEREGNIISMFARAKILLNR